MVLGEAQGVVGAERPDLERLDRELEVVAGRSGAGQMEHAINRAGDPDVLADVVHDEGEPDLPEEMFDVGEVAGAKVVDAHHFVAAIEQTVTEIRTEKSSTAGDDYASHERIREFGIGINFGRRPCS